MKAYIVTLEDGTTYNVSANDKFLARMAIKNGLRNRLDFRKISSVTELTGVNFDPNNEYINTIDNLNLKCTHGWTYKWS